MTGFNYGNYFGPIEPLADAIRDGEDRCWGAGNEKNKIPHDYVLYLGCNVLRTVALAEMITAILMSMGIDYVSLGGPSTCCGIIHHSKGDKNESETLTEHTLAKFKSYDPKAVLTYCPSCHAHIDYALLDDAVSFDVPYLHVTEFIVENLDKLKFRKNVDKRVMFHGHSDDEQARRDSEFARKILEAVPGLEVVDATGGAEWGHDCGSLQISMIGPDKHKLLVTELFEGARAGSVDGVATLYHSCYRNMCGAEDTHGVELIHYTSLVMEALNLCLPEERYKTLVSKGDPETAFSELVSVAERRQVNKKRLRKSLELHFGKE